MDGDTYYLSGLNVDSNYSSINFVDNELSNNLPDIDDSIDVNKKLESLQSERSNLDNIYSEDKDNNKKTNELDRNFMNNINTRNDTGLNHNNLQQMEQLKAQQRGQESDQLQKMQRIQQMQHQQMQQQQMHQQQTQQQQMHQQQTQQQQMQQQQIQQKQQQLQQQSGRQMKNLTQIENFKQNKLNEDQIKQLEQLSKIKELQNMIRQKKLNNPQIQRKQNILQRNNINNVNNELQNMQQSNNNQLNDFLNEISQKQLEQLQQVQLLQEQLQSQIKNQKLMIYDPGSNNRNLGGDKIKDELISKVKILTGELEKYKKVNRNLQDRLTDVIQNNNNENERKLKIIEEKKNEIKENVLELNQKHNGIEEEYKKLVLKEKYITNLIKQNELLLKSENISYIINSNNCDNSTKYSYELGKTINNLTKLELISYDFPLLNNNINHKNNKLYLKINHKDKTEENKVEFDSEQSGNTVDDNEIECISIPEGNYTISSSIKKLNKTLKSQNIQFLYNKNTNKVSIKLLTEDDITFSLYNKEDSILKKYGFNLDVYEDNLTYLGERPHDLRMFKYIKIYITNIDEDKFAEISLLPGKTISYTKEFKESLSDISKLDIEIRTPDNELIDFCDLRHKMEIRMTYINKKKEIVPLEVLENINDSSDDEVDLDEKIKQENLLNDIEEKISILAQN